MSKSKRMHSKLPMSKYFAYKNKWDKMFTEGNLRRLAESQMRPKEELDEIVQNIIKYPKEPIINNYPKKVIL